MCENLSAGVVIATYKRHRALQVALEHWEGSTRRPEQLIIVDASPDAAEQRSVFRSRFESLLGGSGSDYVVTPVPSSTAQRNAAIDRLWTDVAAFVDDDSLVHPDYLERIMEVFESDRDRAIGAVQGVSDHWRAIPRILGHDLLRPFKRFSARIYVTRRQAYPMGVSIPRRVFLRCAPLWRRYHLWGACMSFRTELVRQLRLDENMRAYAFAEDFDLSFRAGRTHGLVARLDARIHHATDPGGRIPDLRRFLIGWINPAYLIEKLVPFDLNRRALHRTLSWERLQLSMRGHPTDGRYGVAQRMVDVLAGIEAASLVPAYLELQSYVLDSGDPLYDEDAFLGWRQTRAW